jgi:hypothetical protein
MGCNEFAGSRPDMLALEMRQSALDKKKRPAPMGADRLVVAYVAYLLNANSFVLINAHRMSS